MESAKQKYIVAAVVIGLALFVGLFLILEESGPNLAENQSVASQDWKDVKLADVASGDEYTISELDKPVLVETFAVWCPTCTRQQQEVKKYHKQSEVTSVSLNTDPNEDASKIKQHIQRNDFGWRYSVAPPELTRSLVEEYGQVMINPPRAPMVLVCENSTRKLPTGVKPVSKLKEEVDRGC